MSDANRGRHSRGDLAAELCLPLALLAIVYGIAATGRGDQSLWAWMFGCGAAAFGLGVASYAASGFTRTPPKAKWGMGLVLGCGLPILILPSVRSNDDHTRQRYASSMHQVALAVLAYERDHGRVPPAVVRDARGQPLYSWRVLVLPYLLYGPEVYEEFHLDEPWDSPHNRQFLDRMPRIFESPGDPRSRLTHIAAFVGPGTMFEEPSGPSDLAPDRLVYVPDGAAQTLLLAESSAPIPWTAPFDLEIVPDRPLPALGGSLDPASKQFMAAFADGSVRLLPRYPLPSELRAMISRDGGEPTPDLP